MPYDPEDWARYRRYYSRLEYDKGATERMFTCIKAQTAILTIVGEGFLNDGNTKPISSKLLGPIRKWIAACQEGIEAGIPPYCSEVLQWDGRAYTYGGPYEFVGPPELWEDPEWYRKQLEDYTHDLEILLEGRKQK